MDARAPSSHVDSAIRSRAACLLRHPEAGAWVLRERSLLPAEPFYRRTRGADNTDSASHLPDLVGDAVADRVGSRGENEIQRDMEAEPRYPCSASGSSSEQAMCPAVMCAS